MATIYADPAAEHPTWEQLLSDAVHQPGTISAAYSAFHTYSVGNQLLALFQCAAHRILHLDEEHRDGADLPRNVEEVEAESVAHHADPVLAAVGEHLPLLAAVEQVVPTWTTSTRLTAMQALSCSAVKFETPTKRALPLWTTSSSAGMLSSNGVLSSGQWISSRTTQSVPSRCRLASISRRMLARLESRTLIFAPGGR